MYYCTRMIGVNQFWPRFFTNCKDWISVREGLTQKFGMPTYSALYIYVLLCLSCKMLRGVRWDIVETGRAVPNSRLSIIKI